MSDSALTRAIKRRYEQGGGVSVGQANSGTVVNAPAATHTESALTRAIKQRQSATAPAVPSGGYPQPHLSQKMAQMQRDLSKERYEGYRKNQSRIDEIDGLLSGQYTAMNSEYKSALTAEKKRLEDANRVYERFQKTFDEGFATYSTAEDWETLSKNRSFNIPTLRDLATYGMTDPRTNTPFNVDESRVRVEDPLGTYMKKFDTDEEHYGEQLTPGLPSEENPGAVHIAEYDKAMRDGAENHWELMTGDEVDVYYYLLSKFGKEKAQSYLDGMAVELGRRGSEQQQKDIEESGTAAMIGHNILSVPANVVGGVAALPMDLLHLAKGEEINPYTGAHVIQNYGQNVRGVTAGKINEATGASASDFITWGDAYQGIMSGIDSAAAGLVMGPTGAAIALGTNAGASEAKELFEKGASQGEMVAGGLLAGATEAVFEKVSIGYFLDDVLNKPSKNIAQSLMKTLGQAGVEASEEFCTTLGNYLTDAAVRGSTSDIMTMVKSYEDKGYTHGAAVWEAVKEIGGEALHSAAIGAISGGAMGAGGSVVSGNVTDAEFKAAEYARAPKSSAILSLFWKVKNSTYKDNDAISLGTVSKENAEAIREITGVDVTGWSVQFEARMMKHIQIRHGEKGKADQSMADPDDIAKIEYVIDHAEEIADGGTSTAYSNTINGKNRFAKTVMYQKDIGGRYYYVVEAVPDTKKRTLQIVSARINKKKEIEGTHLIDGTSPDATSKNVGAIPSNNNVAQSGTVVNTQSMQERADYSSNASLGENASLQNRSTTNETIPPSADADTSLYTREAFGNDTGGNRNNTGGNRNNTAGNRNNTAGNGNDAQVVERALQLTAEGKRKATATDLDGITAELGEEEALRRLYDAQQFDRPTGTVEIDGRRMDAGAYVDAYEQTLPNDPATLREKIYRLERAHDNEILRMHQEGTLKDYKTGGLKIDLQLFAARRKLELLQLEPGEDGSKVRQFWEKRLRGTDPMHSEELLELMAGRSETYDPISNQKTLDRANEKLRSVEYQNKLMKQLGKRSSAKRLTEVDVAAAIVKIKDAYNDGDYQLMMDLIAGLSRRGTELGRAVQAFSMMARMTPEGTLKAAQRTIRAEADYIIGEGADDGLNVLADDITGALDKLARLKGSGGGDTSSTAYGGPPSPQGEGVDVRPDGKPDKGTVWDGTVGDGAPSMEGATREQIVDALVDDLAATEGTYLTREDIEANLNKIIQDATDVPEQVKRYVLKKLRKKDGGLAQRLYEMHRKGHLTAEATRRAMEEALELPTLTEADVKTLVDMTARVQELAEDPVAQADAMEEIYDFLGAKMSVKFGDALQAWRKFAMLANVKTHVRNMVSNGAYVGIRKADQLVAVGLEKMFRVKPENRGAYLGWSHTEHGQSIRPLLEQQAKLAVLEMQKRGAKYETGTGQLKQRRKSFGKSKVGEALNKANRRNSEWLEREDVWFFKPAYIDALGQIMTAQSATEVTPQMHETAMQRALEATFRADNAISEVLASLKRYQNSSKAGMRLFGHAVDVVIPFSKTPANIAIQTAMHSPLGIAKGAYDLVQRTRGKSDATTAEIINEFSKGITGTALMAVGLLLGSAGLFNTGFGKTEKERAADELAGRQENAIIIGDTSITLDWLQPAASPLIVGASMGQRIREEGMSAGAVFGAVMDGTDSLFELSMLQSLYDILGGYDAGATATAASIAENVVSQSVPTLLGQAARAIDPVQRKTTGDTDFETIVNQVVAKIPVLTYLLDPELDVWGNEVYRTGKPSESGKVLNAAQQFVLPMNTKTGTGAGDPISQEILRLYDTAEEGKSKAIPTAITRDEAQDKGLDYVEDNRVLGMVNRQAVEDFIHDRWPYQVQETLPNGKTRTVTKYYSEMTDDERRRVLSRIYGKAKKMVLGEDEEKKTKSKDDRYFESIYEELK